MLLVCLFVWAAKSLNQQTSPSPGVMQALVEQVTLTYAALTRGSRLHATRGFMTLKIMVATNAALRGGFLHKEEGGDMDSDLLFLHQQTKADVVKQLTHAIIRKHWKMWRIQSVLVQSV